MSNLGIELEELIDLLSRGHEAIFSLGSNTYIIQSEIDTDDKSYFVMYRYKPTVEYLCRIPTGDNAIVTLLNTKCINNSYFMDLIDQVHVDEMF